MVEIGGLRFSQEILGILIIILFETNNVIKLSPYKVKFLLFVSHEDWGLGVTELSIICVFKKKSYK